MNDNKSAIERKNNKLMKRKNEEEDDLKRMTTKMTT